MTQAPRSHFARPGPTLGPAEFLASCPSVWTLAKAKLIDEQSQGGSRTQQLQLMERAGAAVADHIVRRSDPVQPVLVLCGRGDNGGDGFVVARLLAQRGYAVTTYTPRFGTPSSPAAESRWLKLREECREAVPQVRTRDELRAALGRYPQDGWLLVDALMGIGYKEPLEDRAYLEALAELRNLPFATVFAVDLPSGLAATGEEVHDAVIPADVTITFGAKKIAHVTGCAPELCGEVIVAPIGFDPEVVRQHMANRAVTHFEIDDERAFLLSPFGDLAADAHKYDRGHVLVLGGHSGMNGAAWLAARAAYTCGAGWVSLSLAEPDGSDGCAEIVQTDLWKSPKEVDWQALERYIIARKVRSLVIGPGLRQSPLDHNLMDLLQNLAVQNELYVHIDAGALAGGLEILQKYPFSQSKRLSLSPHPGEWQQFGFGDLDPARPSHHALLFTRLAAIGGRFLYKTARPLVMGCEGDHKYLGYFRGELPQLAKAGTGDVLSGIIGALGAAGALDREALILGYAMLKKAAVLATARHGRQGVTPKRLIATLGHLG